MKNAVKLSIKVCCASCQHKPAGSFMTMCPHQRNPSDRPNDEYCDSWMPKPLSVRQAIGTSSAVRGTAVKEEQGRSSDRNYEASEVADGQ